MVTLPHTSTKAKSSARQRLIVAASALFYQQGIRAVGVDAVAKESGVSKTSLYRAFASKDELVVAVMTEEDRHYWTWWEELQERNGDDQRELLISVLSGTARRIGQPGYRGCPFLNFSTEFPDHSHPGRPIARAHKQEIRRRIQNILIKLGTYEPDLVAGQIVLLIEGAYVTGTMTNSFNLERELVTAATRLIAEATPYVTSPVDQGTRPTR
ncbi:TetR/AcrR family transcriptional regulator [Caballeronia sp. 15715]|uniref:TetR/AcrR family transcriptional regulator n=1 Tax=Caballeronia sp. 15715 TaxID=3391030 RepID=UPI0039E329A7